MYSFMTSNMWMSPHTYYEHKHLCGKHWDGEKHWDDVHTHRHTYIYQFCYTIYLPCISLCLFMMWHLYIDDAHAYRYIFPRILDQLVKKREYTGKRRRVCKNTSVPKTIVVAKLKINLSINVFDQCPQNHSLYIIPLNLWNQ